MCLIESVYTSISMSYFVDIGDISQFSYFKEFEKVNGNDAISDTGEVYSGTLYQNNDNYQTDQVVTPSKDEVPKDEESSSYYQPIFYSRGEFEEYRDPEPSKDTSGAEKYENTPSNPKVEFSPP